MSGTLIGVVVEGTGSHAGLRSRVAPGASRAQIRSHAQSRRRICIGICGAGSQTLHLVPEVRRSRGTDSHTFVSWIVGKTARRTPSQTPLSVVLGVTGLGSRAVSHAQFGKIVSKVAGRAVEGELADPSHGTAVGVVRTGLHAGLSYVVGIVGGKRGTPAHAPVGGIVSVGQLRNWTHCYASLSVIIRVAVGRTLLHAQPRDVLGPSIFWGTAAGHAFFDAQLPE